MKLITTRLKRGNKLWRNLASRRKGFVKKIIFVTATSYRIGSDGEKVHVLGDPSRTAFTIDRNMCIGSSISKLDFNMKFGEEKDFAQHIRNILNKQNQLEPRFLPQAMVLTRTRAEVDWIVKELDACNYEGYAIGISGTSNVIRDALKDFTNGKHRVAVTCRVGLEGYDNTSLTLCVVMRRIVTGKIMFSQFVGRCMRIKRGLEKITGEDVVDRTVGMVISYEGYEQEGMRIDHEEMDKVIANDDPNDDEVDDGENENENGEDMEV